MIDEFRVIHREIQLGCGCTVDICFEPMDFDVCAAEDVEIIGTVLKPCHNHKSGSESYKALLQSARKEMRDRLGYNEKLGYGELTDSQVIHIALRAFMGFMKEGM